MNATIPRLRSQPKFYKPNISIRPIGDSINLPLLKISQTLLSLFDKITHLNLSIH